jgi:hypothetical protein
VKQPQRAIISKTKGKGKAALPSGGNEWQLIVNL